MEEEIIELVLYLIHKENSLNLPIFEIRKMYVFFKMFDEVVFSCTDTSAFLFVLSYLSVIKLPKYMRTRTPAPPKGRIDISIIITG